MGVLARILSRRRLDRRRGALAEDPLEPDGAALLEPEPTVGTPRLVAPDPTPSMRPADIGTTAGTRTWRSPGGTPSTERLHNPRRPGQ